MIQPYKCARAKMEQGSCIPQSANEAARPPKEEEAVLQLKILRFPKETEEGWGRPTRIG